VCVCVCVCSAVCVCYVCVGLCIYYTFIYIDTSSYNRFLQHERNPLVSTSEVNLVREFSVDFDYSRIILIKLHGKYVIIVAVSLMMAFVGVLMIVGWLFFAGIGKFTAGHMKPALPNGHWFQIHRIFMILALFFTIIGFILIFVAFRNAPTRGLITLGELVGILL